MNRPIGTFLILTLLLLATAPAALAQFGPRFPGLPDDPPEAPPTPEADPTPDADPMPRHVTIETAWSATGVKPGKQIVLAVIFDIEDPWHIQTNNEDWDGSVPTQVQLRSLPQGVVYGDIQWPSTKSIEVDYGAGPQTIPFFVGRAVVFIKVSVDPSVPVGEHTLTLYTRHQACDDTTCLAPVEKTRELTLNVVSPDTEVEARQEQLFDAYTGRGTAETLRFDLFGWTFTIDPTVLWLLLVIAAVGGFLLNLTPCVLPLIPIKIMALANTAGSRGRTLWLGLMMLLGVMAFWLAIGGTIALVSGFDAVNQLFQYPAFTIGVGVVIAIMGLGMWGLFTARLPQWVYRINPSQETTHGSIGFGIMTAVLSTPCTAPFMGTAAAWATKQPTVTTLATFGSIGLGMGLPYLVLAAYPRLVERMPRAGAASELIKQVMGLLMLAAAAYFLGTGLSGLLADPPDPPSRLYWWAVAGLIIIAGLWLIYRTVRITPSTARRLTFGGIGAAMIIVAAVLGARLADRGPIDWIYYTPQRLAAAQDAGKVVVMDFTAEWCLNCHALEQSQLHQQRVVELLNSDAVAPIKVDLTGKNVVGNQALIDAGRRTIPLLVVYRPDGREVFKSDAYKASQVIDAVNQALGAGAGSVAAEPAR